MGQAEIEKRGARSRYDRTWPVLLAPLMELASERYVTEKQLGDAEHDVIRALERVFFE